MERRRVLLVEDDASLRRFVALAIEDVDAEFIACASVAEALGVLQEAPVHLIVTDLMMPGESGVSLLQRLHDEPSLRGGALIAVFSAGLDEAMRRQLAAFDVWRMLVKPVSAKHLVACVSEALWPGGAVSDSASSRTSSAGAGTDPVAEHFGGDASLFYAFRESSLEQIPIDIGEADAACARGDLAELRRIAHSLKSVLRLLGENKAASLAKDVEDAAASDDAVSAQARWSGGLKTRLVSLTKSANSN